MQIISPAEWGWTALLEHAVVGPLDRWTVGDISIASCLVSASISLASAVLLVRSLDAC